MIFRAHPFPIMVGPRVAYTAGVVDRPAQMTWSRMRSRPLQRRGDEKEWDPKAEPQIKRLPDMPKLLQWVSFFLREKPAMLHLFTAQIGRLRSWLQTLLAIIPWGRLLGKWPDGMNQVPMQQQKIFMVTTVLSRARRVSSFVCPVRKRATTESVRL